MKKTIITLLLPLFSVLIINAQIADGYYHIKNTLTDRYLSINDTKPENYQVSQSASVNLAGIRTYINYDTVAVSPSCVVFISSLPGGGYNVSGQGSSLYAMTNYKLPIDITPSGDSYIISGTYSGFTLSLKDRSPSDEDGFIVTTDTGMEYWTFLPINTTSEYIGIHPDIKTADGTYWGTIYAGFSFRLVSEGMAAFYVSNAGGTGFTMNQIEGDVVPAGTPVIIRCNSENVQDNKIEPVIGAYDLGDITNCLGGVYCSLSVSKHFNRTPYDPLTMRILGLSDNGELAFVKNIPAERLHNELYLMANKAYLQVDPKNAADVMTHGGYTPDPEAINDIKTDDNSTSIYTLMGVRLPNGVTPKAGIYVKNGRKIIIK